MPERASVAEGRLLLSPEWPRWKLRCIAVKKGRQCGNWAVRGMTTCRMHGSGGENNRRIGELRYMCWVICGGPQHMPVAHAARVALHVYSEAVLKQGKGTPNQQMKAALWITQMLDSQPNS